MNIFDGRLFQLSIWNIILGFRRIFALGIIFRAIFTFLNWRWFDGCLKWRVLKNMRVLLAIVLWIKLACILFWLITNRVRNLDYSCVFCTIKISIWFGWIYNSGFVRLIFFLNCLWIFFRKVLVNILKNFSYIFLDLFEWFLFPLGFCIN